MYYDPVKYFDEMNILKKDKIQRADTAQRFQNSLVKFFRKQMSDLIKGTFLHEKDSATYREELTDLYMIIANNSDDAEVAWKAKRFGNYIQDTTENVVLGAEGNETYQNSVMTGSPMNEKDIPQKVFGVFADERANEIALNETNWIYNYLNHLKLVDKGNLTHTWESMKDERVRLSHVKADEQTVPIDEPFIVNGYKMMFPLDDSLGAPVSEIIGCRCIEI